MSTNTATGAQHNKQNDTIVIITKAWLGPGPDADPSVTGMDHPTYCSSLLI